MDDFCGVTGGPLEDLYRCHQRVGRTWLGKSGEDNVYISYLFLKLGDGVRGLLGEGVDVELEEGSTDSCRVPPRSRVQVWA